MFSLDLVLIMLAAGALGGVVTSLVTDLVVVQFLVAVATSVGDARRWSGPALAKRLHTRPRAPPRPRQAGRRAGPGHRADHRARRPAEIKLAGEIWSAQPYDETLTIEPGETVEVLEIRGATAYVHPVARLEA